MKTTTLPLQEMIAGVINSATEKLAADEEAEASMKRAISGEEITETEEDEEGFDGLTDPEYVNKLASACTFIAANIEDVAPPTRGVLGDALHKLSAEAGLPADHGVAAPPVNPAGALEATMAMDGVQKYKKDKPATEDAAAPTQDSPLSSAGQVAGATQLDNTMHDAPGQESGITPTAEYPADGPLHSGPTKTAGAKEVWQGAKNIGSRYSELMRGGRAKFSPEGYVVSRPGNSPREAIKSMRTGGGYDKEMGHEALKSLGARAGTAAGAAGLGAGGYALANKKKEAAGAREMATQVLDKIRSGGSRYAELMRGGRAKFSPEGYVVKRPGNSPREALKSRRTGGGYDKEMVSEALKSLGARAGTAAGAAGVGAGGYALAKRAGAKEVWQGAKNIGSRYAELLRGGKTHTYVEGGGKAVGGGKRSGNTLKHYRKGQGLRGREAWKSLAARGGTATAIGGVGAGAAASSKKEAGAKEIWQGAKNIGSRYGELMAGGAKKVDTAKGKFYREGNRIRSSVKGEGLKATGARAGTALAAGGVGYAASKKEAGAKEMWQGAKNVGNRYRELMAGGAKKVDTAKGKFYREGNRARSAIKGEGLKATGARAGTAAAVGGLGYAASKKEAGAKEMWQGAKNIGSRYAELMRGGKPATYVDASGAAVAGGKRSGNTLKHLKEKGLRGREARKALAARVGTGAAVGGVGYGVSKTAAEQAREMILRKLAGEDVMPAKVSASAAGGPSPGDGEMPVYQAEEVPKNPTDGSGYGNQGRSAVQSNMAAINYTKREAKLPQKKQLKEVLTEPALSPKTDSKLNEQLRNTGAAGVKIAGAMSRAILQKIAEEGCTCEGGDAGTCPYCRAKKSATKLKESMGDTSTPGAMMSGMGY